MINETVKRISTSGHLRPSFVTFDDNGAFRVVLIQHLTVQTGQTFVRVDLTGRVDRLNEAFIGTGLTRRPALFVTFQPVKHA